MYQSLWIWQIFCVRDKGAQTILVIFKSQFLSHVVLFAFLHFFFIQFICLIYLIIRVTWNWSKSYLYQYLVAICIVKAALSSPVLLWLYTVAKYITYHIIL